MRVILLKDVPKVGKKNEIKEVSDGFARNFLLAKNLARPATQDAVKAVAQAEERKEREKTEQRKRFLEVAEKLKSLTLLFKVKMGEKGKAFGSITPAKIHEALQKQGIAMEKEWIVMKDSIKTKGEHRVTIQLPHEIRAEVKISIESE